jgi:hypothetical protein
LRVEVDNYPSERNWFGFHDTGGDPFDDISGCTRHNAVLVCSPDGDRFVFQLRGGNDLVDLWWIPLVAVFALTSEVHGGPASPPRAARRRGSSATRATKLFGLEGADRPGAVVELGLAERVSLGKVLRLDSPQGQGPEAHRSASRGGEQAGTCG